MQVVESRQELQRLADAERARGQRIALVPTMGALHSGHLSLVDEARKHADQVWVSIFVNPTQFNEAEDFEGYPREMERDLEVCSQAGVDLVYAPRVEEVYPDGAQTWVDVEKLAQPLCGASRPGHFRGVTTVVSKLFLAAKPHVAVFGQKDFQQVAVIRRMARDLGFDVEVIGAKIVREPDGLALSSRNVRLGPEARKQAPVIVRGLDAAEAAVADGERSREVLLAIVRGEIANAPQASLDYAELRDPDSLETAPDRLSGCTLLAIAVHFAPDPSGEGADVRLIDNRLLLEPRDQVEAQSK
jgi:pantoate--beta-alanine ligase